MILKYWQVVRSSTVQAYLPPPSYIANNPDAKGAFFETSVPLHRTDWGDKPELAPLHYKEGYPLSDCATLVNAPMILVYRWIRQGLGDEFDYYKQGLRAEWKEWQVSEARRLRAEGWTWAAISRSFGYRSHNSNLHKRLVRGVDKGVRGNGLYRGIRGYLRHLGPRYRLKAKIVYIARAAGLDWGRTAQILCESKMGLCQWVNNNRLLLPPRRPAPRKRKKHWYQIVREAGLLPLLQEYHAMPKNEGKWEIEYLTPETSTFVPSRDVPVRKGGRPSLIKAMQKKKEDK